MEHAARSRPATVPTRTGAIAAGSVRTRAAISQIRTPLGAAPGRPVRCQTHGAARELREVRLALLEVGVAPLLRLLAHVEEQVGVVGELLDPGEPVLVGVEAGFQQAQREGGEGEHLAAPAERLILELGERDDRVDQPHLERLLCVVLAAQEPDLLGLLRPDQPRQDARAEAAVERADLGAGLAEARVVGGDRQVADDVQHVAAADRRSPRPSPRPAWASAGSGRAGR